jgi:putative transposase
MSSTHLSLHYHIVFGTKNHEPMIQPAWRGDLHAYLGGITRSANGIAESVGGVSDHVHLLIGLRATHCLVDVLRDLKAFLPVGFTMKSAPAGSRGRKVMGHLL